MELVESNFELLACGEPCSYHHPPTPMWTGKSINPTCILHTLVRIMKDPMSEDQVKRQLYLLSDLQIGLKFGFWVQDIENSTKLIEMLLCKGECMPIFYEYAKYLLCLMRYPPLMCRTNEILEYHRDVQGYFDFFGYMLVTSPKLTVRQIILQSLKDLLNYEGIIKNHSMPLDMIKQQIELSNLPIVLVQYMELCNNEVYFELIQIMSTFASFSSSMGMTLLKAGCLQIVMMRLDPEWQDHLGGPRPQYDNMSLDAQYPLDDCIMLMHTLLDAYRNHPRDVREDVCVPTVEALWGYRYALRVYTIEQRSSNERNFIAALCLLLAECFPEAKFLHAGIVQDVALLSTIGDDATMGGTWTATLHFDPQSGVDFEFKRMMMLGLILFVDCLGSKRIYQDEEVLPPICKLLDNSTRWASQYHEALLLTALQVLDKIVADHVQCFLNLNGLKRLNALLQQLAIKGDKVDNYHTYFHTLTIVYKMLKVQSTYKYLNNKDIEQLRKVQMDVIQRLFDMDLKLYNQKLMTQSLDIIGVLPIDNCAAYVDFVVALLQRVLQPRPTDLRHISRLFVSAIWLLWKYGVSKKDVFLYFIKLKGVYLVLDFLKEAEFSVQLICLGLLADIMEHEASVPYFVTWQKDGVGILAMLMNLFYKECVDIGVEFLPRGVIADSKYPLMGTIQKQALINNDYSQETSPSITDLFFSCRPRIYAILRQLNYRHGETLEIVNEYYKTYETNLTIDHKITKLLCDNYLTIKIGEMWMELEIFARQIGPVSPHQNMLDTMLQLALECGANIQKLQNNWLAIERKNDHIAEEEFYNLLRESKLGGAIQAFADIKYMARCTNPLFRSSMGRFINIDREFIGTHRTNIHRNFMARQKIIIQSDVILDPFAPEPPPTVSSSEDDDVSMFDLPMSEVSLFLPISCHREVRSVRKERDDNDEHVKVAQKKNNRKKKGKKSKKK